MRHFGKALVWTLVGIATGTVVYGITPDLSANPFQNITLANVFRLQPPPAEPAPPVKPNPPLPPIALTGIRDGYGKMQALIQVVLPAVPPNPAKTTYLTLAQGERDGEIQVLKIDVKAGTVEVKLFGTVTNLCLNSNAPTAPAPVPLRNPNLAAPLPDPTASQPISQPISQLNRDEYALVIEAERERLRQAGEPTANLMPPTHLTPAGAPGTEVFSEGGQATEATSMTPMRQKGR